MRETMMVARVFQIIAITAILLGTLMFAAIFFFLGKFLKSVNKTFVGRGREISGQMKASMDEMDSAQEQLKAFGAVTSQVRGGMDTAIVYADRTVSFLKSNTFQLGLPLALWFLLLVVTIPRGIRAQRVRKRVKAKPIPPPSWEEKE